MHLLTAVIPHISPWLIGLIALVVAFKLYELWALHKRKKEARMLGMNRGKTKHTR